MEVTREFLGRKGCLDTRSERRGDGLGGDMGTRSRSRRDGVGRGDVEELL